MATPHVSGVIALMLQKNKNITVKQIRDTIKLITNVGTNPPTTNADEYKFGYGAGLISAKGSYDNTP